MATGESCGLDVLCHTGKVAGSVIGDATDNLANQVLEAFASVIASLGTLWVNVGTPNLTDTGGASSVDGASAPGVRELTTVLGYVTWVSLAVAIIALMILGALIATRIRTGEGIASMGKVGLILGGVALVGGAGSIVSALLPNGPVGVSGTVAFLQSSLWPYMLIAAALSVVVGGARMFWESRAEPGKDLLRSLLTLAVVGGAGVTVVALLVTAADRFSVWVINNSLACDVTAADGACFEENVGALLGLGAAGVPGQVSLGSVLVIIFGLIAILASVVQIVLMVARSGMLVILAGILPLAASFTNTEMGRSWFKKCIGWLVAFILYKPAAAVVYAAAFQLTGTDVFADDGSGILAVVTGLMLMVLALFAMPALMRFVTPMVSSLAAGGGGAAVAAGTMAAIPTGAAAVGRLATGAGGGGAATASNAAPQSSSHNTNTSTSTATSSPSGAGQGGSKGSAPAPTGAPSAGGAQAASAGGGAATGAAAGGTAATGAGAAAAGPAGAALAAGLQAGQAASSAAKNTADQVTGDGPSGSN
ncbi:hypothetical protein [Georgenia daeguensis]|uniref:Type IV secretion system protein n=1 Tax=Georgenia daeguensis TaxID=908355 RepID=A0ABP6UR28_9MICO